MMIPSIDAKENVNRFLYIQFNYVIIHTTSTFPFLEEMNINRAIGSKKTN